MPRLVLLLCLVLVLVRCASDDPYVPPTADQRAVNDAEQTNGNKQVSHGW